MKKNLGLVIVFALLIAILSNPMVSPVSAASLKGRRLAILNSVSPKLPNKGDLDVLLIDGKWLQGLALETQQFDLISQVEDIVLSGVPTVVVGGDICLSLFIEKLAVKEEITLPLLAQALKVYPEGKVGSKLVSDQLYITGINVTQDEVKSQAIDWAFERTAIDSTSAIESSQAMSAYAQLDAVSFGATTSSTPSWTYIGKTTLLVYINPCGNLNVTRCWYQLSGDGNNTYDWLTVINEITSTPGRIAYGSDWNTADIWNYEDFDYYADPHRLVDHGPPDTSGVSSVTYQTGVTAGVDEAKVTCKMTVNYPAQDVTIHDDSTPNQHLTKWWHDVPEDKGTGQNTYTIKPGATVRLLPLTSTRTYSSFQVQYAHWVWIIPGIWGYWAYWKSQEFPLTTIIYHPREVNIFVIKASDSPSWWVGNVNDVESGIVEAANDAFYRTRVKVTDEPIYVYEVTSTSALYDLAMNPPLHAVFVNTHGEVLPMPNQYFGPSVYIYSPSDGSTINYSPTVYAYVYPSPPSTLQQSYNPNTGEYSYVWYKWVRSSTGATSDWRPMYPQSNAGGSYYGSLSLPAYDTYTIYVGAYANFLWTNAYITVYYQAPPPPPPGGGGGCPYISTWDGSQFILDNNLLPASENSNGTDFVDYYKLQKPLVPNSDGTCSLAISEFEQEHSFFDQVQLLTVDHPSNVNIAVSPCGEVLTYTDPHPAKSAIDNDHNNVKNLLSSIDGMYYEGYNGSFVTLNFGEDLDLSLGAKLVMRADPNYKVSILVQVQDSKGNWKDAATVIPRVRWSTEIIDMSKYLPDEKGNLKVRLYFTANHKLDFVGLDTSPQTPTKIETGQLVSATHGADGIEIAGGSLNQDVTTYQNLLYNDSFHEELTPGYRIKMNFTVSEKETIEDIREYVLVTRGRYKKAGDPPRAVTVNWQPWFELLQSRMKNYGWIWTNVAGYSAYYFGNTWYTSKFPGYSLVSDTQQPRDIGLKKLVGRETTCRYDGQWARRGLDFLERTGFDPLFYNNLPTSDIAAARPIAQRALPWNTIGLVDTANGDRVTASITMNNTSPTFMNGIFIHSGLAPEASDFVKGYIAAMLGIEEARAFIYAPKTLTQTRGNIHHATFSITMLPGGWGEGSASFPDVGYRDYRYVDLVLTVSTHYKDYLETYTWWDERGMHTSTYITTLDEVDYKFTSDGIDTESWAEIWLQRSGWETGGVSTEFMDDFGWWSAGLCADILGSLVGVPYLGNVVGIIPILIRGPSPPNEHVALDRTVWANRTAVDPNDDEWGTVSYYFRVILRKGSVPRPYYFALQMASWLGQWYFPDIGLPYYTPRLLCIPFRTDMISLTVTG